MVFLVKELESERVYVLKFYRPEEIKSYKEEFDANFNLLQNFRVMKAVKAVTERE